MISHNFKCRECDTVFENLIKSGNKTTKCECKGTADIVYLKAPSIHGCDSFNPHFDYQMGEFFGSQKEKESFLDRNDRTQVSGMPSPRITNGSSIICSKTQASALRMSNRKKASIEAEGN